MEPRSVVGSERVPESGYLRAKLAQEKLIKASPVPYAIVRATQFFEFIGAIAQSATDGQTVRLSPALLQPIAGANVAAVVADVALASPLNGTVEIAGPEPLPLDELVRRLFVARQDARRVTTDPGATYFGAPLNDQSLTPGDGARLGPTHYADWLAQPATPR
jgi:uncharacterized protein YbjT (DUF2867 family)